MQAIPKFEIYDYEETPDGVFKWGPSRDELFEKYYEASDEFYTGEIETAREILKNIVHQDAHFIDAYNLLATIEMELGNIEKGTELQEKAFKTGQQIVPDDFDGRIRWGFTENRPFLRAMHAMGLNHMVEGEYEKTIEIFEKILGYNPDDNQGIRYLIGDLYFLRTEFKKAGAIYKENQNYPPYLYSYGLLHIAMGNHKQAITFFRRGILENIYISDYLRMKVPLIPYEIWHRTNFEMPETAYSYLGLMEPKWMELPEAIGMLDFLHLSDDTHAEIQQMYMLKNELYHAESGLENEEAYNIRGEILGEIEEIKKGITQKSSEKIYKEWTNHTKKFKFQQN